MLGVKCPVKEITELENKKKAARDIVVEGFERVDSVGDDGSEPGPVLRLGGGIGVRVERRV
jgi:hypothetical protein